MDAGSRTGRAARGHELDRTRDAADGAIRANVRSGLALPQSRAATQGGLPRATGTVGFTAQANLGPVQFLGDVGVAVDTKGRLVGYLTGGNGLTASGPLLGASAGLGASVNNGLVGDYDGKFDSTSVSAGLGPSVSAEHYHGTGDDGRRVDGLGFGYGSGEGASFFKGKTSTLTTPPIDLKDFIRRNSPFGFIPGFAP